MDLGKKLEIWILGGGYSLTSDLDLGKKVGNVTFWGGYSATLDLDLGKKLEIWILGGVFCNFRFGLRKKVGNLDSGGGGYSVNVMEKEKNQNNIKILLSTQSRG